MARNAVKLNSEFLIVMVLIFLMLISTATCISAPSSRKVAISSVFGQVDVAMVILFHPLMDFYYPREKLFTYEFDRKTTVEALNKEFAKLHEVRRKAIADATQRIKQMQESIARFHSQKMQKREECRRNMNNLKAAMNSALSRATAADAIAKVEKDFRDKILAEERNYSDIARQIDNKLENMGELYEREKEKVKIATFADADRQMENFEKVTGEIEEAIYKCAENMKVSIVFNGTSIRRRNRDARKNYSEAWKKISLDDPYSRFGVVSLNANDFLQKGEKKYRSRLNMMESYLSRFEGSPVLENLFLVGGTDLTPEVIRLLHQQHGYSGAEISEVLEAFEAITASARSEKSAGEGE